MDADAQVEVLPMFRLVWLPISDSNETKQSVIIASVPMVCAPTAPNSAAHILPTNFSISNEGLLDTANATQGVALNSSEATPYATPWNQTQHTLDRVGTNSVENERNSTLYAWWNCTQDFSSVPTNNSTYDTTELLHSEKSDFAITVASTELAVGDIVNRTSQLNFASSVASPTPDILPSDALNVSSKSVLPFLSVSMFDYITTTPPVDLPLSDSASDILLDETSAPMVANGYLTSFPADSQSHLAPSMIGSDTTAATSRNQFVHSSLPHDVIVDASVTLDALASLDLSYDLAPSVTLGTIAQTDTMFPGNSMLSSTGSPLSTPSGADYTDTYRSSTVVTPAGTFEEFSSSDIPYTMSETPPLSSSFYTSQSLSAEPPGSSLDQQVSPTKTLERMQSSESKWDYEEVPQGDEAYVVNSSQVDVPRVTDEPSKEVLIASTSSIDDSMLSSSVEITPSISSQWKEMPSSPYPTFEITPDSSSTVTSQQDPSSSKLPVMTGDVINSSHLDTTVDIAVSPVPTANTHWMTPSSSLSDPSYWSPTPVLQTSMATRSMDTYVSTSLDTVQQTESIQASDLDLPSPASSALFSSLEWQSEFVVLPSSIDSLASAPTPYSSSPVSVDSSPDFTTAISVSSTSVYTAVESTGPRTTSPVIPSPSESPNIGASKTASTSSASSSSSIVTVPQDAPSTSLASTPSSSSPHLLPSTTLPTIPPTTTVLSSSLIPTQIFPVTPSSAITSPTSPASSPSPFSSSPVMTTSTTDAIPDTSLLSQTALPITPTPTLPVLTTTQSVIITNQITTDSSPVTSVQHSVTESASEPISTASETTPVVRSKETTSSIPTTTVTSPTTFTTTNLATTTPGSQLTTSSIAMTSDNKQSTAVTNEPSTTSAVGEKSSTSEKVIVTTTDLTSSVTASRIPATEAPSTKVPLPSPVVIFTEPPLNTSDALMEHWLKTVIEERVSVDVMNKSYVSDMEMRLAGIYDEGFRRLKENKVRNRRATTVGDTTLQMVNVSREASNSKVVTMVYFMERFGNLTPALQAVAAMETFNIQEITLRLEHVVLVTSEVYAPPVAVPPHDPKLWLIAAVLGGIVGSILFVWCVLFIYCKCTQPVKQRQRTPRTPRSTRISMTGEYDTNSYRNKMPKIQGFDIARTEVGLENEIQRDLKRKPPEPYRRRPDGSTELEGMYSPGETPPPKQPGDAFSNTPPGKVRESGEGEEVTPVASLNMNKSRSQIPIDASLRRSLPPRPDSMETIHPPKKKSSSKKKRAESEESESEDDLSEDRKPLSTDWQEKKEKKSKKKSHRGRQEEKPRSKSKKKHRKSDDIDDQGLDSSQAGVYENIAKMSRNDPSRPEKLRSTQHAIKLPPLITQPLVGEPLSKSLREETELQESLQQKADIERWRNKQRQRERTKGSKSGRTHPDGDSRETRHAYKKAQKEIAAILGDPETAKHMPDVFQKKKKRKKHKQPVENKAESFDEPGPSEVEMRNMVGPASAPYSSIEEHVDNRRSREEEEPEESDSEESSDDDGSFLDDLQSNEPSLEEARQRMHELVDNAFALISPRYRRHNRVAPSLLLPPRGPAPLPAHGKASARVKRRLLPSIGKDSRRPSSQGQAARNTEEDDGPRHTPLYITRVTKTTSPSGKVLWSPYDATDEVSRMSDDQNSVPGVIQTTPDVSRHQSDGSDLSIVKPVSLTTTFNYTNPAYVNDSDGNHSGGRNNERDPVRLGSQSLANTSLSHTTTTTSSGADSGSLTKTPRDLRKGLQHDGYTSIYMDSSHLNPRAPRSHSPPERDSHGPSQPEDRHDTKSDFVNKENQENAKHLAPNGVAMVLPLGSQSGSFLQSGESLVQSNGPLHMLSEQTSLQLPSTEVLDTSPNAQKKSAKEPTEIRLKHLDPKIPKLSENGEVDEIDVIQRALKRQDSHWNKSLRSELERLANHSSADTTITTAMV